MTEYKIISRKVFGKEATLLDQINNEARGTITKAVLEHDKK